MQVSLSYRGVGQLAVEPEVAAGVEELELLSPPEGFAAGFSAGLPSVFVSDEDESDEDALLLDA